MRDTVERLREELRDPEYSEGYAESFLDSYIATQIKVLREQNGLSQKGLAELVGTGQGVISRIENVNYSKWNVSTLKRVARAFRVRVKVSFETYGSLLDDVASFSRKSLEREPRESDPVLNTAATTFLTKPLARRKMTHRTTQLPQSLTESNAYPSAVEGALRSSSYFGNGSRHVLLGARPAIAEMAQR